MQPLNVLADGDWAEWPWPQPDAYRWPHLAAGRRLGGEQLGGTVYELDPGQKSFPYHWHAGNEELLIAPARRPRLAEPRG